MDRRIFLAGLALGPLGTAPARAESFAAFLAKLRAQARRGGHPGLRGGAAPRASLTPQPWVLKHDQHQAEFTQTWAEYSSHVLTPAAHRQRPGQGRQGSATCSPPSPAASASRRSRCSASGGWRPITARQGNFNVIDALATLAWDRQSNFFAGQVIDAMRIIAQGDAPGMAAARLLCRGHGPAAIHARACISPPPSPSRARARRISGIRMPTPSPPWPIIWPKRGGRPGSPPASRCSPRAIGPAKPDGERATRSAIGRSRGVQRLPGAVALPDSTPAALLLPDGPAASLPCLCQFLRYPRAITLLIFMPWPSARWGAWCFPHDQPLYSRPVRHSRQLHAAGAATSAGPVAYTVGNPYQTGGEWLIRANFNSYDVTGLATVIPDNAPAYTADNEALRPQRAGWPRSPVLQLPALSPSPIWSTAVRWMCG